MTSQPPNDVQPSLNVQWRQDVPCSRDKSKGCSEGAEKGRLIPFVKSHNPGYEGLVWQKPKEDGTRITKDDHPETESWVWTQDHGWKVWTVDGDEMWLCKLCYGRSSPKQHWFKSSKSTSRVKQHMRKEHGINSRGSTLLSLQNRKKRKIDEYTDRYETGVSSSSAPLVSSSSFGFWKMYLQCIIADEVPLPGLGPTHLQLLITYASPQNRLPPLQTVSSWIKKTYDRRLSIAAEVLTSAATKVSISLIIHTAGVGVRLLGVRTYFIDHNGRPTIMFVSMPRRQNGHAASGTTDMVSAIIDEHHLRRSLGYIATDDFSNSAACLSMAAFTCHPTGHDRRLQCLAYFLDSLAHSILFGCVGKGLEGELVAAENNEKEQTDIWRKRGPYGKLHNVINYIKKYSQREERFTDIQRRSCVGKLSLGQSETSKLLQDKVTRWESMRDSIGRALHLRSALDEFVDKEMEDQDTSQLSIAQDCLAPREWEVLKVYHDILQRIGNTVEVLQGEKESFGAIWQVLPQFEALVDCLDQSRRRELPQDEERDIPARLRDVEHDGSLVVAGQNCVVGKGRNGTARQSSGAAKEADDPISVRDRFNINVDHVFVQYEFNARLEAALQQTQDFCETLRGNTLYVAAVALHPRIKWRFFEAKWKDCRDRLSTMKQALSEYWQNNYSDTAGRSQSVPRVANGADTRAPDEWSDGETWDVDQFEEYQSELPDKSYESTDSPVDYWVRRRRRWPQLAAMALDIYSVPVMAGESEIESTRLTKDHSLKEEGLDDETKVCLMCLRIWQRDGTIEMDECLFE